MLSTSPFGEIADNKCSLRAFRFDPTDIAGARLQRLSFGRVRGFTELADRDIDGHAQVILCFTNPRAD